MFRKLFCSLSLGWLLGSGILSGAERPNFVFILCDDLGLGDVSCYNATGKIPTPHVDELAKEGMRFTDAHTSSSVCTPTRYSIMTGRYHWRSRLQKGVLGGLSPRLIEEDRVTVASFLQSNGYHTACIGKWHLGMDWAKNSNDGVEELAIEKKEQNRNVDYTKPIGNGPNAVGFDYFYGISASLDMVPYTFIENDKVVANPSADGDFPMMAGRKGGRTRNGPLAPGFDAAQVLPVLTEKAVAYIGSRAKAAKEGKPFFLYLPYASPHTPIVPTPEWDGKSGLNPYADFTMHNDACVGEIMKALEENGLSDNTVVIFTSDNGCSPQADFDELKSKGHDPSMGYRGHKADIWEGGHRVPFIVRWPGHVKAGSVQASVISSLDFFGTCAAILEKEIPGLAAEDSFSFLDIMKGNNEAKPRGPLIHQSISGVFAIREGKWKLCFSAGSGGWSKPGDAEASKSGAPPLQLFDMENDPTESKNRALEFPDEVERLTKLFRSMVKEGRTRPGPASANTVEVVLPNIP